MSIRYIREVNAIWVKDNNKTMIINADSFRKHCTKYGIPMKSFKDLNHFLQNKKLYLPKQIYSVL